MAATAAAAATALSGDAPGYGVRPVCWKCSGKGTVRKKRKKRKEKRPSENLADGATNNSVMLMQCPVCHGVGTLQSKRKEAQHALAPGVVTSLRARPDGWKACGVLPVGNPNNHERLAPRVGEALTGLCGDWRIFQKVGGHRFSTDDVVTAWFASIVTNDCGLTPRKTVDLGCGIGSVLLQCAWLWPEAALVGVEAQPTSAGMARRSIEYNVGYTDRRVKLVEGDIRDENILARVRSAFERSAANNYTDRKRGSPGAAKMDEKTSGSKRRKTVVQVDERGEVSNDVDLITGTPPYFQIERDSAGNAIPIEGGMPSCINSAPARNEFRGGVEVYCDAAARILRGNSPRGRQRGIFVVTMAYQVDRVEKAAKASGLVIFRRVDVIGKEGKTPLFATFAMRLAEGTGAEAGALDGIENKETHVETLTVRGSDSRHTRGYEAVMLRMGIPPLAKP